jgi:thiamine transport system substrate-binding protein
MFMRKAERLANPKNLIRFIPAEGLDGFKAGGYFPFRFLRRYPCAVVFS